MVVPDLAQICEIMLIAEGFQASKILARKFVMLYKLCEDLLSKVVGPSVDHMCDHACMQARHYDWKLRAIKTTLYVAGNMKRAAPELTEEKVLLRALRDFNLGKLAADDRSIFLGLLNDLFPGVPETVPQAVDLDFSAKVLLQTSTVHLSILLISTMPVQIREAAVELGYQPDPTFCLKVAQLREIFSVRWSVFLLGPAGCGKTAIWKTLARAQQLAGEKTVTRPINPKVEGIGCLCKPVCCQLGHPDTVDFSSQPGYRRSRATSCTATSSRKPVSGRRAC